MQHSTPVGVGWKNTVQYFRVTFLPLVFLIQRTNLIYLSSFIYKVTTLTTNLLRLFVAASSICLQKETISVCTETVYLLCPQSEASATLWRSRARYSTAGKAKTGRSYRYYA